MRKILVIGVSILSVFILFSLSYQPIIADEPIETITQLKESKASNLDVDELKELYKLIELKFQSNDDCGCGDTTGWDFPIFCNMLYTLAFIGLSLFVINNASVIGILIFGAAILIAGTFMCPWVELPSVVTNNVHSVVWNMFSYTTTN